MRILSLASAMLMCSCQDIQRSPGSLGMGNTASYNSPEYLELEKHVDRFYSRMGQAGFNNTPRNLRFVFDYNMTSKLAGLCTYPFNGQPGVISINMDYWSYYSAAEKEILVFHEMGHCVLLRDHDNVKLADSRPRSVMNSILIDSSYYQSYKSSYISELFMNAKIPRGGTTGGSNQAVAFQVSESYSVREPTQHDIECGHDYLSK